MDRQQGSLLDRESRILSELVARFGSAMKSATRNVTTETAVAFGQAGFSSMQMDVEFRGLVNSMEELLALTRLLRELWLIGPLTKPGKGESEAEAKTTEEMAASAELIMDLRAKRRRQMMYGEYADYEIRAITQPARSS